MRWLIYISFFFWAVNSTAQCDVDRKVFQPGEKLTYKAYYNWNFIWLEAADVVFKVEEKLPEPVYKLSSLGISLPKYDWFYKVRDTFRSEVNNETLLPLFYHRNTSEGSYKVNNKFNFDYEAQKLYASTFNSDSGSAINTFDLKPCTFDVLSAIYYTRTLSFENRNLGDTIPLRFFIDNEYYDLYIRYLGKEEIETREKKIYSCIKFNIMLVEGTIFKGGEDMTVWATDDENHVPILVEAKILIGSVKAFLTDYSGLKYTMKSYLGIRK
ncbi:MAG: DUF3108 domain-containing protein [Salinivirgaceae bacterium]|nr:MAG: DUF3108 domain-containing protein [Salinivirgaceae bacterium]